MIFANPLGLLGLIGVPILVIIYIIKNTYTEQTIASVFMWKLSEKFLKRKNPLSKLTGIISLILQILFVTSLSLAIAEPTVILPNSADEYCIVIDGSAGMGINDGEATRFEKAKNEAIRLVEEAENGSIFTVILADENVSSVLRASDDEREVIDAIRALEVGSSSLDTVRIIGTVQELFNDNSALRTCFFTDTDITVHENIEVVNVRGESFNLSLLDLSFEELGGGEYTVKGSVTAYGTDRNVDIVIYGSDGSELGKAERLAVQRDTVTEFECTVLTDNPYSFTAELLTNDGFADDNKLTVYDLKSENSYKALLVSDEPMFLEAALSIVSNADVRIMTSEEYIQLANSFGEEKRVSGYGLYIFDSYTPALMPKDGTVWFFAPMGNVEDSGFSLQGDVVLEKPVTLSISKSTGTIVRTLTEGMLGNKISVIRYNKYGVQNNFTTLLTYAGQPMVFTGLNSYGNRQVVFAFDIHDTDLALAAADFLPLVRNLLNYSFPTVVERTEYYCGDTAEVNVVSGCKSLKLISPSGKTVYADITASAIAELVLDEVGEYKIIADIAGNEREFYIYSSVPTEERDTAPELESLSLAGEAGGVRRDGKYELSVVLFILAAVLFTAEWAVYCYDKYQLR